MNRLLLIFLLLGSLRYQDKTMVYICDSPGAKKYHLRQNCRGLSRCRHHIVQITLDEAKKRGKTLCGWEK